MGRKRVVARATIEAGRAVQATELAILRPGTGIQPAELEAVIGRRPLRTIPAGTVLEWEMFE